MSRPRAVVSHVRGYQKWSDSFRVPRACRVEAHDQLERDRSSRIDIAKRERETPRDKRVAS